MSAPSNNRSIVAIIAVPLVAIALTLGAATWTEIVLDGGILPLENRIAVLGPAANDPDLLVFTLWSTGTNQNHLGAFFVPQPYDGTGVTFTQDIDVGILYGVGNICVPAEDRAVVPYIRWVGGNYDVYVAEYDGATWSTSPLPQTSLDDYHTSDCFVTPDGIFLMVLNATDDQWEFFQRPLSADAADYPGGFILQAVLPGGPGHGPQDPWDGGGIATATSGWSGYQPTPTAGAPDVIGAFPYEPTPGVPSQGEVEVATFDTDDISGSFQGFGTPNAVFEQGIHRNGLAFVANQRDGQMQLTRFDASKPGLRETVVLGNIDPGSVLPFQGIGVTVGADGNVYVLADKGYEVTPDLMNVLVKQDYPFRGFGGPVNIVRPPDMDRGYAAGPGNPMGQVLATLDTPVSIFADGFESGDTSSWSSTNP